MHNTEFLIGLGIVTVVVLVILWMIWPYVVGFLAVLGAIQVVRFVKQHKLPPT